MFRLEIEANTIKELKDMLEGYLIDLNKETSVEPKQAPIEQPATPLTLVTPSTASTVVPTQTPTYTHEQLSLAAANLLDKDPAIADKLPAILADYGVTSLLQIPAGQLGSVAQNLRQLGAQI